MEPKSSKTKAKRSKLKKKVEEEDDSFEDMPHAADNTTLYQLLEVEQAATIADIIKPQKKAYRTLALKLHPDKNKDDPEATKNFQKINEAYQILIDPEKRKLYDETGYTGDDNPEGFAEAFKYFRQFYKRVEKEDIEAFAKKYRFSQEEIDDVVKYYNEYI